LFQAKAAQTDPALLPCLRNKQVSSTSAPRLSAGMLCWWAWRHRPQKAPAVRLAFTCTSIREFLTQPSLAGAVTEHGPLTHGQTSPMGFLPPPLRTSPQKRLWLVWLNKEKPPNQLMLMFFLSPPLFAAAPALLRVLFPAGRHSPVPATSMPLRHPAKVWRQMPLPRPLAARAQAFA